MFFEVKDWKLYGLFNKFILVGYVVYCGFKMKNVLVRF